MLSPKTDAVGQLILAYYNGIRSAEIVERVRVPKILTKSFPEILTTYR